MRLSILYRGPLSSCNYACSYCPFAKRRETRAQLAEDRCALTRFVQWVRDNQRDQLSILFTPWGEALIRPWYQAAMVELSQLAQVERVAVQTNLSGPLSWLARANTQRLGLWVTYHPGETTRATLLQKVKQALSHGVRLSVGMVGLPEHLAEARALRSELPADVYLWINAAKRVHGEYQPTLRSAFSAIDPHFELNTQHHESFGHACATGEKVISVDGDGSVRRCHFVPKIMGNLYDDSFRAALAPRPCPNISCGCHIGYVHLERLGLYNLFEGGVLERIPRAKRSLAVL